MADYIDREALLMRVMRNGCTADVLGVIMAEPAADVAPVVRCKECVWTDNDFVCYRGMMAQHKPEDFCSYGERRARE